MTDKPSPAPASSANNDSKEEALWSALRHNKKKEIQAALKAGPDLEKSLGSCGGAAAWAILCGSDIGLHLLLDRGANPNASNASGTTPMFLALNSSFSERERMVATLLEYKADPNPSWREETPLIRAARLQRPESFMLLLQAGANPNAACAKTGATALMWACYFSQHGLISELIHAGANTEAQSNDGRTARDWAIASTGSKLTDTLMLLDVVAAKLSLAKHVPYPGPSALSLKGPRL